MNTETMSKNKNLDRHAVRELPDEELTPEQLYHREYHRKNKERRAERRRERRKKDREFREQDIQRLRDRRAERRKEIAETKLKAMVEDKREKLAPTRRPRLVEIDGWRGYAYGTGTLAREVGRESATVRAWLASDVLPGASVWVGVRAHFTPDYCAAVRRACLRLLRRDGRGDLDILTQLVREEFKAAGVSYVRRGETRRRWVT